MPIPEPGWDDEGRRLSPLVDTLSAVVIIGADSCAAAQVALGLARAQAERRRVVIGDLVGDLEQLESLIPRHDPHGLADSFTYGISLNRIGYAVEPGGNLYIMPSGSEPVATEAVIGNPRWQRLVAGFREVDALLLLVAEPAAPALERLVPVTDGAILVGDTRLEAPSHVIARARPRGPRLVTSTSGPTTTDSQGRSASTVALEPTLGLARPVSGRSIAGAPRAAEAANDNDGDTGSGRRIGTLIGIVVAAVALAVVVLLGARVSGWGRPNDAPPQAPPRVEVPRIVSAPAADPPPPVENPLDSARASAYSVVIVAANTAAGADDNLRRVSDLPGATASPSIDGGALWYKVFVGAFGTREAAEAFRDSLRLVGRADETVERIVALPFAFLIADAVVPDSAAAVRETLLARGVPTYALIQADGLARIYAGAFATPEEAMHLAPVLRAAGVQPRIVYRTGRLF
jgi:hypothetical protein